ncbi:hypothetical protein Taro_055174, partial [Colocasia esculenta]|nr:hypothetical protein [Colocasia esculenta]
PPSSSTAVVDRLPSARWKRAEMSSSSHGEATKEARPRLLLPGFLPQRLCKELEFIHRSSCAVGYRPGVLSTTLSHLAATGCAHLIIPFKLKEKVEEQFGCEFELFVEFTGLISWCKGANIGWHSDDNRPYLKQRDFAAVCYLNNYGKDFRGGIFHFKDGEPASIIPQAGDAVIYTADDQNIHSVDEVTDGERLTLTLWFTRDSSHDEDAKLISLLSERLFKNNDASPELCLPFPAPDNMYWFTSQLSGFDIRCARLHILGYNLYSSASGDKIHNSSSDSLNDPFEQLARPLRLGRGEKIFNKEFTNILHALQVVQFYNWKASELQAQRGQVTSADRTIQPFLVERTSGSELMIPCDPLATKMVFGYASHASDDQLSFDWDDFACAVIAWEDYVHTLHAMLGCKRVDTLDK